MQREDFIKKYTKKHYLGDGLFVQFDGFHFILSTDREDGKHWVGLEPSVFHELIKYRKEVYEEAEQVTDYEL